MESIIVAIVIGIIVNIFNRFSDNEKDKRSPGPVANLPEMKQKEKKKKTAKKFKKVEEEVKIDPPPVQQAQRIGSARQERLKVKEDKSPSYEIEEEDVLKGIIFSQVLSPPKARRRK